MPDFFETIADGMDISAYKCQKIVKKGRYILRRNCFENFPHLICRQRSLHIFSLRIVEYIKTKV